MTSSCNVVDETWKAIDDFSGYEVSDHGRVKSFRRASAHKMIHGQILSSSPDLHGYARVNLCCVVAKMLGISRTTVFDIKRGRSWRGIGEPI